MSGRGIILTERERERDRAWDYEGWVGWWKVNASILVGHDRETNCRLEIGMMVKLARINTERPFRSWANNWAKMRISPPFFSSSSRKHFRRCLVLFSLLIDYSDEFNRNSNSLKCINHSSSGQVNIYYVNVRCVNLYSRITVIHLLFSSLRIVESVLLEFYTLHETKS